MPLTIELKARWCDCCGIDLFLSNDPLVISEHVGVCDVCRGMNQSPQDADELEEIEYQRLPYRLSADQIWGRFRRRIRFLKDRSREEYLDFGNKIKRAERAIKKRDAKGLLVEIGAALDYGVCREWKSRLDVCHSEAEQIQLTEV